MEGCIFCKIINGEIPCAKVYEDDNYLAFLDISPAIKGHTLVVPKEHIETINDIGEDQLHDMISVVKKIADNTKKVLSSHGINIVQNNGKAAGQLVPHMHIHIIPRYENDGQKIDWKPTKYDGDEMKEYQEKLKQ